MRHAMFAALLAGLVLIAGRAEAAQSQIVQARPYTMAPGDRLPGAADRAAAEPAAGSGEILDQCGTNPGTGDSPANVSGAANKRRMVVVTNSSIGVYRQGDCTLVSRETLKTFIEATFPVSPGDVFDEARVIYDPSTDRFFVTVTSDNRFNRNQSQFFGVSKNGLEWFLYRVVLSEQEKTRFCKQADDNWWNSPSAGRNEDRWFVSANQHEFTNHTSSGAILDIDKAPTLEGQPATVICFNGLDNNVQAPIVLDDAPRAFFLAPGTHGGSEIRRYELGTKGAVDKDVLDTGLSSIPVPEWRFPTEVAQPNGERLYANDGRFVSPTIQVGRRLFNVHSISINNAARVRYYRFSFDGELLSQFLLPAAAGENHFNASMATGSADDTAPAFVTFSRTIPGEPTKGRLAMMMAVGPNSKEAGWESFVVQTSPGQYFRTRHGRPCNESNVAACFFGFWSTTQIDPQNPNRAWGFNQLITTGSIGGAGSEFNWTSRAALAKAP